MNKSTQSRLLNVLDEFLQVEAQKTEKRNQQYDKAKARIAGLEQEIEGLRKNLTSQRKVLAKDSKAYLKILEKHEARVGMGMEAQEGLKAKFKDGKISLNDYKSQARNEAQIRSAFRQELQEELQLARPALRSKSLEVLRTEVEILQKNFLVLQSTQGLISEYSDFLNFQLKRVQQFGQPLTYTAAHMELQRKESDLLCAERGGLAGIQIEVTAWEDMTLLALDSRIQERHISDLEAKQDELLSQGFDFEGQKLVVAYSGMEGFMSWQELPTSQPPDGQVLQAAGGSHGS